MSDRDILLILLACQAFHFTAWLVRAAWRAWDEVEK